ncbi:hypothetical protein WM16_04170 [Burkholderia ubonensis]|uniref:DUF3331 domain-containing protein n=1 Tax=Burkholderia ubonensis TaxID=101571 RepID=A0A108CUL4_9BURK|nr:DUF3331 domain-containing protein [Burkholderia ubonensis]KWE64544.1 hypothetical protein WL77_19075 [Burkholderia ubonensis]KWE76919.1 hypothetical protein WL79_08750 [Burkholderia ubonensis]KWK81140.1 hypothetical protein WM16_04170 [Burkholderia ubonensis]
MKSPKSLPVLDPADVHVEILERSDTLLVVRWVEPGRCHYGEQRWRRRFAQRTGTCALSRQAIQRGDEVFRPAERPAPANAGAMISAAEVLALAGGK